MAGPGLQQTANTVLLGRQSPAFVPLGPGEHPGGPCTLQYRMYHRSAQPGATCWWP